MRKNQPIALLAAVAASVLSTVFESNVKSSEDHFPVDFAIYFQVLFCLPCFLLLRYLVEGRKKSGSLWSPANVSEIDPLIWQRGLFQTLTIIGLNVALTKAPIQILVYAFFFVHPLAQLGASRWFSKTWPALLPQLIPLSLIIGGISCFAIGYSGSKGLLVWMSENLTSIIFSACAGVWYAFSNEIANNLSEKRQDLTELSITTSSAFTAAAALLPIGCVLSLILPIINVSSLTKIALDWNSSKIFIMFYAAMLLLVVAAEYLLTLAFARATFTGVVAAADAAAFPTTLIILHFQGQSLEKLLRNDWIASAMALIFLGAITSAIVRERKK